MVTVVNEGPDPSVVKEVVCESCGARLAYVPNDIQEYRGRDYGGGPDGCKWIDCPKCSKQVTLESW